jgi:hypothetical protein
VISRALRAAVVSLVLTAIALYGTAGLAQVPDDLEILSSEYNGTTGLLSIQLRAGGSRDVLVEQLTVLVDGAPRTVEAGAGFSTERPSVLLAIDTSGSMAGSRIAAAREAGRKLVGQLSGDDSVGLLTFASAPVLDVPLSAGLSSVSSVSVALAGLTASGETALYDAIALGLETLASAPSPRALVLLSDGEESGVSTKTVDDTWQAVSATDVVIHSFALGDLAPGEFLRTLSDATGGTFWSVTSDAALEQTFVALGGRLGASRSAAVRVPGLVTGDHSVTVRARVGGRTAEATSTFSVRPSVSLTLTAGTPGGSDGPLSVDMAVSSTAPVDLTATIPGAYGAVTIAGSRAFIDPWVIPHGEYPLLVEAWIMGEVVAAETLTVSVPVLSPVLDVTRTADDGWRAVGRVQPEVNEARAEGVLIAIVDGEAFAQSSEGELVFAGPTAASELLIELRRVGGATVLAERFDLQLARAARKGGPVLIGPLALAAGGSVAIAGLVLWRRRRTYQPREVRPLVRRLTITPDRALAGQGPSRQATLRVTGPDGDLRTFTLGPRPLRAGSTDDADIQLTGEGVRREHARFSLTGDGDLRIHGVGHRGARPYDGHAGDEWIVVRAGEEVAIGDWRFSLVATDGQQEAS